MTIWEKMEPIKIMLNFSLKLKLADIYNDLYFVIRFKIDQNYNLLPKDLPKELMRLQILN